MRTISVVSSALMVLGLAVSATAQEPSDPPPLPPPPAANAPSPADRTQQYGLNLSRIQRGLQKSAERQDYDGLNLRYYVNVYAQAPAIKLFTPLDDLLYGPTPSGGPTHRDMMNVVTPQEFRAPAADLSSLARWLGNKAKK